MPAGRPSKYLDEYCEQVAFTGGAAVYGLHDGSGNVFYVGKSKNLRKRLSIYRRGHFHGNRRLEEKVAEHGLHIIVLRDNPSDLHNAEFDEIESRQGLVNCITDRNAHLYMAKSTKPWVVAGVKCPSAQVQREYISLTGKRHPSELFNRLNGMSDCERLETECKIAVEFHGKITGIQKWIDGVVL